MTELLRLLGHLRRAAVAVLVLGVAGACAQATDRIAPAPAAAEAEIRRLYETAWAAYLKGAYDEVLRLATDGLALAERVDSAAGVSDHLNLIGKVHYKRGDYARARDYYVRGARAAEAGGYRLGMGRNWSSIGSSYFRLGDYRLAREYYERSLQVRREIGDLDETARALNDLANVHQLQGEYARALALREEALGLWQRTGNTVGVADVLNDIAWTYSDLGDWERALGYLEQSLALSRQVDLAWGVADGIEGIGLIHLRMGRAREAAARFREAHALFAALGNRDEEARSLLHLGEALRLLGDHAGAGEAYARALAIGETVLGGEHPRVAATLAGLGALAAERGRLDEAEALSLRALGMFEKVLGPEHPSVAATLATLAGALGPRRPADARPLYERARRIQLAVVRANVDLDDEAQRTLARTGAAALRAYTGLLAALAGPSGGGDPSAARDAFVVGEQVRGSAAQTALARAAARVAIDDPATAALARRQQDLRGRRQALRARLADEYARPEAERDPARLASLQEAARAADRELAAATADLLRAFPRYAELAAPELVDPAGAQALLRPGEALVSFLALDDRLLVWLARRGRPPVYQEVAIGRRELAERVARVRASADQSAAPDLDHLVAFDVAGAHALWARLLAPLGEHLAGVDHLVLVPDDTLLPLPFAALVTSLQAAPAPALVALHAAGRSPGTAELAAYARLPWLAREYALTVLPSATALRALRQTPGLRRAPGEPLIAFGDPVLAGGGRRRGGRMLAARGASVSVDALRALDRLPGTRAELQAVAAALGADPARSLFLDARATEPAVRALDASGRLGGARVLAFATHALIGGELRGLAEPALVLTPPARPTAADDGLLSLGDVLALRLDGTEWVILSACNTAAADGSGEGLSGLARAFFFAGARALLVSHWSVDDEATRALMTEVFRRWAAEDGLARAEALRRGMLALMQAAAGPTAYFAHPFAWAPFFLVGDGGAEPVSR